MLVLLFASVERVGVSCMRDFKIVIRRYLSFCLQLKKNLFSLGLTSLARKCEPVRVRVLGGTNSVLILFNVKSFTGERGLQAILQIKTDAFISKFRGKLTNYFSQKFRG